ncbi:MAG: hypothetical protein R3C14_19980 [Caldilineaceae bacterium]
MLYLIGGAPRAGKSILGQQLATQLQLSWISTDLLVQVLKAKDVAGAPTQWDASPAAITKKAEWFFPCLERFVWGAQSLADGYIIEGVDFLPGQVVQLATHYPLRSIFLGCEKMTLDRFDRFPGRSRGYAALPEEMRRQFAQDVPRWSTFVRQETTRFGVPYLDMSDNFQARLQEAIVLITGDGCS